MPPPAPRPRGPKLKFTPEDDQLLVDLKEKKNLTWKQIADFFPGRSSGTLQVRYCTKLKAKTTVWTDDMVCKQFFEVSISFTFVPEILPDEIHAFETLHALIFALYPIRTPSPFPKNAANKTAL